MENLKNIVEALIFASDEPMDINAIVEVIKSVTRDENGEKYIEEIQNAISELNEFYEKNEMAFRIIKIAKGFQFATIPEFSKFVGFMNTERRKKRLSQAALETLAIVAYRQPITKPEIERIRGVGAEYILSTLLEKNLICIKGRAETVGRPLLYTTTDEFLKYFGIGDITDLPKPREMDEIMNDDEFQEQRRKILMNVLEEEIENEVFDEDSGGNGTGELKFESDDNASETE
ncbi:MAG: SMC-Scp complex subunit ScpB [Ignavibacteria bacterium]|nr:SMC-Scp complex subunit ScpB [Ignavibacteria bacterium]